MKKATYIQLTIEEVEELMGRALANWDRELSNTIQTWEKDTEFTKVATAESWEPSTWLFYAQGDTLQNYSYVIEDTIKEISKIDK